MTGTRENRATTSARLSSFGLEDGPLTSAVLPERRPVTDLRWAASPTTDLALSAGGTIGNDGDVLDLLMTIVWRPPL